MVNTLNDCKNVQSRSRMVYPCRSSLTSRAARNKRNMPTFKPGKSDWNDKIFTWLGVLFIKILFHKGKRVEPIYQYPCNVMTSTYNINTNATSRLEGYINNDATSLRQRHININVLSRRINIISSSMQRHEVNNVISAYMISFFNIVYLLDPAMLYCVTKHTCL